MNTFTKQLKASRVELFYRQYASRDYWPSLRLIGDFLTAEEATLTVFVMFARLIYQCDILTNIENPSGMQ